VGLEADIRRDFLAALRSGRYKHIDGTLRWGDRFCATGVLCDIHPDLQWEQLPDGEFVAVDKAAGEARFSSSSTELPGSFATRLGLDPRELDGIIELNDTILTETFDPDTEEVIDRTYASFEKIADVIESQGLLL
jgi:hypothetical protein